MAKEWKISAKFLETFPNFGKKVSRNVRLLCNPSLVMSKAVDHYHEVMMPSKFPCMKPSYKTPVSWIIDWVARQPSWVSMHTAAVHTNNVPVWIHDWWTSASTVKHMNPAIQQNNGLLLSEPTVCWMYSTSECCEWKELQIKHILTLLNVLQQRQHPCQVSQ